MITRIFLPLLFLLPFLAAVTPSEWRLCLGKKELLSSSLDSVSVLQLPAAGRAKLTFVFYPDTNLKRSVLVMNSERNTLWQQEVPPSGKARIDLPELLAKTGRKPFTIYTVAIPADPEKAMLVRMAPVAICQVSWK